MRRHHVLWSAAVLVVAIGTTPVSSWAHGLIGQRFFPETITVSDPFPADEMDLLVPAWIKSPDGAERSLGFGIQKRLSPDFSLSIDTEYVSINPTDETLPQQTGFANPKLMVKYAVIKSPEREGIVTATLAVSAPYGAEEIGAERHYRVAPGLLFGKGFGDTFDRWRFLKPLAVAGAASLETPMGANTPDEQTSTLSYGLVVEYSIPYLQAFVQDVGIPKPFSRMVPIAELSLTTPVNGPEHGRTLAFVNPGVLWMGKYVELGVEAQIPLNDRTGRNVGVIGLVHLFLDDLAPRWFSPAPGLAAGGAVR